MPELTTKDIADAIRSFGWEIASGAFFWWRKNGVLVKQWTKFGASAFLVKFSQSEN